MTCPIRNCPNPLRWHNTLCRDHARQVPQSLYYETHRAAAMVMCSQRPLMVQAWSRKYRKALRDAVAAVKSMGVA